MAALKTYWRTMCLILLCWAQCFGVGLAAQWEISSETILRTLQRDTDKGDDHRVLPVYEYLRVDYGDNDAGGFAFQGYGWVRKDAAGSKYYQDDPQGDLLYAVLTYSRPYSPNKISLGRQHIFAGVADENVDGLLVDLGVTNLLSLSAYGGVPVRLEETDGRTSDTIYGGRLALSPTPLAELGISYKHLRDNGNDNEQTAGTDLFWSPVPLISIDGRSAYNLATNGWREHNYGVQVNLGAFEISPVYQYIQYRDYFDPAEHRENLFRFLFNSDEALTSWGADASLNGLRSVDIGLRGRHYDYDVRQTKALFLSGLLTVNLTDQLTMGAEAGNMDGEISQDSYNLYRIYCAWSPDDLWGAPGQISADLIYQSFDEKIYGEDTALLASFSVGRSVINEQSIIKATLNYGRDPFFDDDLRGILTFLFAF